MVLITALIGELRGRWRRPVDILTTGPWSEPLLRGQPGVGEIIRVRSRGPVWYCDANDAARPLLKRAGIAGDCIVEVRDHPLLPAEHATEQWRRLGRIGPGGCCAPGDAAGEDAFVGCRLSVTQSQRTDLEAWLAARGLRSVPLVLVQAGNKRTMRRGPKRLAANHKYWPQERWAAVIAQVRARCPAHAILMLGTRSEYALNARVAALARTDRLYNVADDLPIPRLIALLERAAGLITVDSGPAHAAAAVGCPMVVLFGKASPSLYRPLGAPGADVKVLLGTLDGEPSMLGIDSRTVGEAWSNLRLRG